MGILYVQMQISNKSEIIKYIGLMVLAQVSQASPPWT